MRLNVAIMKAGRAPADGRGRARSIMTSTTKAAATVMAKPAIDLTGRL
jgi:hypothetical protein